MKTATATIDPDDFASFQETVQRSTLPLFTEHGKWGLGLLVLLFVMLFLLKDWLKTFTNWLGRILRGWWDRGWSWVMRKRAQRKTRNVDASSQTPAKQTSLASASPPHGTDTAGQAPGGTQ